MTLSESHATDLYLSPGMLSYHVNRTDLNPVNIGPGIEIRQGSYGFQTGEYRNSERGNSRYIAVDHEFASWYNISFGIAVGAVDGYSYRDGKMFPIALPYISFNPVKNLRLEVTAVPGLVHKGESAVAVKINYKVVSW